MLEKKDAHAACTFTKKISEKITEDEMIELKKMGNIFFDLGYRVASDTLDKIIVKLKVFKDKNFDLLEAD